MKSPLEDLREKINKKKSLNPKDKSVFLSLVVRSVRKNDLGRIDKGY